MHSESAQREPKPPAALLQWVCRQGVCLADAEEVLQQARLAYYERRGVDYWEDAEPQTALMYRLLKARIADLRRAQARRAHAEQQFAAVHSSPFDEADLHDYLLGKEILSRLPSPWDQVARWRLEEGLSWSEIARRLHTRVGSVTVRFRRALERVCREMGLECRKVALSSDIKGESAKRRRRTSRRRQSDEQTQGIGDERTGADDSELGGVADHPHRSQRARGEG